MATNPTFFTDYAATIDHVSETSSTQTEIASGTYDWGIGTKSNIVAGSGARWGALSNVWTDPNNWTIVIVAKPDAVKSGERSQVFTLADPGGSYLLVSFHGDYASASSPAECFAAIHYKSGSFRRGGFTTVDVCDGNDHVYIARRTGSTFQIFVDGTEVTCTTLTVGTANLTGTATTPSLHCSGTFGYGSYINRQAPIGLVKFYNEALSDADIATLSSDPWEVGGSGASASFTVTTADATFSGSGEVRPMASFTVTAANASFSGAASSGEAEASINATTASGIFSGSATGDTSSGSITTPALKNNTGTVLANETGVTVYVYTPDTGALVVKKTGQTTNASGVLTVSDALIVAGTLYRIVLVLGSGAEGMDKVTAT